MLPKLNECGSSLPAHWLSEILSVTLRCAEQIHWSFITQWSPSASILIFLATSSKQIIDQWMFCAVQKTYLLILANPQSNKRQKKETLRFSYQHFAYTHLSQSEIFHSLKKKSRKLFTFLSFLNQSSCITSYNIYRFICPIDRLEPELRDGWKKTLKLNLLEKKKLWKLFFYTL